MMTISVIRPGSSRGLLAELTLAFPTRCSRSRHVVQRSPRRHLRKAPCTRRRTREPHRCSRPGRGRSAIIRRLPSERPVGRGRRAHPSPPEGMPHNPSREGLPRAHCGDSSASAALTARSAAAKPILEWVPSQNGLLVEPPHRQSAMVERSIRYSDPSASSTVTGPFTRYGPFSVGVMVTEASVMPLVYNTRGPHSDRYRCDRRVRHGAFFGIDRRTCLFRLRSPRGRRSGRRGLARIAAGAGRRRSRVLRAWARTAP